MEIPFHPRPKRRRLASPLACRSERPIGECAKRLLYKRCTAGGLLPYSNRALEIVRRSMSKWLPLGPFNRRRTPSRLRCCACVGRRYRPGRADIVDADKVVRLIPINGPDVESQVHLAGSLFYPERRIRRGVAMRLQRIRAIPFRHEPVIAFSIDQHCESRAPAAWR